MSHPGPNQREPRPYDWQRQFQQPEYHDGPQPPPGYEQPWGNQRRFGMPDQGQQRYADQGYSDQPYGQQQYGQQQYGPPQGYSQDPYQPYDQPRDQSYDRPYEQPYSPREMYPDEGGRGFRLPGFGLILSVVGIVVQILCMLVLPWVSASAAGGDSVTLPELWDLATEANAAGFGGWYLFLFSYPLAALGIVLSIVSVLEWVAGKVIFAVLAILGIGWLLLRYGVGPAAGLFGEEGGFDFTRQEITVIGIAVGALALVLLLLKTGLAMFRRIAGLVLIGFAAVHLYAVRDMFGGFDGLDLAAYGPAVGYALSGVAALIGPRRIIPG
jgi:hypothetical protein